MIDTAESLDRLRSVVAGIGPAVVAFSGGADSALVARVTHDVLGRDRALAVTAVSPSLPEEERVACAELAAAWGLRWRAVETDEMTRAAYLRNDRDRCFHCKDALMDAVLPVAEAEGATVVLGVNMDDLGDHRPGQRAAADRGARFPLVDAGLTKDDVRRCSRELGLTTWDKPAAACLASRLPYGTRVSVELLGQVERAERGLRALGFGDLRVRHYDDLARIEVLPNDFDRVLDRRVDVVAAIRSAGYRYVTLDLAGLRSGNLNDALGGGADPASAPLTR
jgi:uncharacterized protein